MRVALLNTWYWPEVRRGSERLLHDLAADLTALGHEATLITSHRGRGTRTVEDGFAVIRSPRPPLIGHAPFSYRALTRGRYDVAVAAHVNDAAAATRWSARTGRPAVLAYMGLLDEETLGAAGRKRRRQLDRAVQGSAAVVALSGAARDGLRATLGVEARVIRPGVDLEHFTPGGERHSRPTIACLSDATEPRKRVDALVRAFAELRQELPTARLILAQPADPALTADGVEFTDAVRDVYRQAWVTALPATNEAFGLVLAESLACGTPVVARRDGGVPEIVDRPEIGRLYDDDLVQALRETLALAEDPGTAAACRARAEELSSRATAAAYVELFAELCGSPSAPTS